jgi:hypothetical protein
MTRRSSSITTAAPRFDADRRDRPNSVAIRDRSFNLVAALLTMEPTLLWRRAAFGLLGDRESPGFARAFAALVAREWGIAQRLPASLRGQTDALAAILRGETLRMTTFCETGEGASGSGGRTTP